MIAAGALLVIGPGAAGYRVPALRTAGPPLTATPAGTETPFIPQIAEEISHAAREVDS
jgi:hypothetical protein